MDEFKNIIDCGRTNEKRSATWKKIKKKKNESEWANRLLYNKFALLMLKNYHLRDF